MLESILWYLISSIIRLKLLVLGHSLWNLTLTQQITNQIRFKPLKIPHDPTGRLEDTKVHLREWLNFKSIWNPATIRARNVTRPSCGHSTGGLRRVSHAEQIDSSVKSRSARIGPDRPQFPLAISINQSDWKWFARNIWLLSLSLLSLKQKHKIPLLVRKILFDTRLTCFFLFGFLSFSLSLSVSLFLFIIIFFSLCVSLVSTAFKGVLFGCLLPFHFYFISLYFVPKKEEGEEEEEEEE